MDITTEKHFRRDFDDLDGLLNWLRDNPRQWEKNSSENEQSSTDWVGTRNYNEAQRLARYGWKEGREKMGAAVRNAARSVSLHTLPARWLDVAGAYPLVPAAVAGDPYNMVNFGEDLRAQTPVVRFLVSCSASGGVDVETIMQRGAAILSWIDALEEQGFRCEVNGTFTSKGGKHKIETVYGLKRADEHLDIDRLAYALVHPSMLRRHMFAFLERSPKSFFDSGNFYGYGQPDDVKREPGQIHFGKMHYSDVHWHSADSAVAYVREQIEAGGIRLEQQDAA